MLRGLVVWTVLVLIVGAARAQPVRSPTGPQTAGALLKEVKQIQESLAGTWSFSDCDGPGAFCFPGYREMPKRFEGVKLVISADKVAIEHGQTKAEERYDIPLTVDAKTTDGKSIVSVEGE